MAALLLIGYNSSKFMTLLSPPMAERSMEIKLASQKWRQLQNMISRGSEAFGQVRDLDAVLLGLSPDSDNKISNLPDITSEKKRQVQPTEIQLPILSGILRNTDIHGNSYATAIIDGHRLKENDRILGFRIHKIMEHGVVVTNRGQRWFLSAPKVSYSRVHTTGIEGKDPQ